MQGIAITTIATMTRLFASESDAKGRIFASWLAYPVRLRGIPPPDVVDDLVKEIVAQRKN